MKLKHSPELPFYLNNNPYFRQMEKRGKLTQTIPEKYTHKLVSKRLYQQH